MRFMGVTLAAMLVAACAGTDVEGERITDVDGEVHVCGEGDGLPACKDYNNLTYQENLQFKEPTDKEMATEASKVRAESPQQLEKTISELEEDPELIDTMAE